LKFLEMVIEVTEFVRNNIGVRQEVKLFFAKFMLHLGDVEG